MKAGGRSPELLVIVATVALISFALVPWTPHAGEAKASALVTGALLLAFVQLVRLTGRGEGARRSHLRALAPRSAAQWAVLAWLAFNWVSLFRSAFPPATWERLTGLTLLVLWAWLVMAAVRSRSDGKRLLVAYLLCAVAGSVVALVAFWMGATRVAVWPFGNPNFLAGYLLIPVGLCLGLALDKRVTPKTRMLSVVALVVVSAAIGFADSLSGWIAALTVLGVVAMGQLSRQRRYRVAEVVVGVAGLVGFAGAVVLRYLGTAGLLAIGSGWAVRGFFWKWSMTLFGRHPFLGSGAGTVFPSIMPVSNADRFAHPGLFNPLTVHSHNDFLEVMVELGVVGLVAFLVMLYLVAKPLGRAWMRRAPGGLPGLELGLFAGFLGLNVQACFSVAPRFVEVAAVYWLALGLLLAWPRLAEAGGAGNAAEPSARGPRTSSAGRVLILLAGAVAVGWGWYQLAWLPLRSALDFGAGLRAGQEQSWGRAGQAYYRALSGRLPYVDRVRVLEALGDLESRDRQFAQAATYYREARRLAPGVADVQVALADALTRSGNVKEGLALYREVTLSAPGFPGLKERLAYANARMGERRRAAGDYQGAVAHFRDAVTWNPDEVGYYLLLAECLAEAGLKGEAEEVLRRAAERFADRPEVTKGLEDTRSRLLQGESSGGGTEGN